MEKILPFRDLDFDNAFEKIASLKAFKPYMDEIINAVVNDNLDRNTLNEILSNYKINDISDIKENTLDLLLLYVSFILDDGIIAEKELANLKVLKLLFKIREGDFYKLRYRKIEQILDEQFKRIYENNNVDSTEALLKVGLQDLFDLSYDQFQELSKDEVKAALQRGANLDNLDAVIKLSGSKSN